MRTPEILSAPSFWDKVASQTDMGAGVSVARVNPSANTSSPPGLGERDRQNRGFAVIPAGFRHFPGRLDRKAQEALVVAVLRAAEQAPFYRPLTRGGPMSVEMTNLGPLGWIADSRGYGYRANHPITKSPWPPIPAALLDLWATLGDPHTPPDACLVNLYRARARMGLHQDRDEVDFSFPVVSVSLGDTALFRIGRAGRGARTSTLRLSSGDVCVMAGDARLARHGVDRILADSSSLIPGGGRINLTLRRARLGAAPRL